MSRPVVPTGQKGAFLFIYLIDVFIHLPRRPFASALFTPSCTTPAAHAGVNVASSEEARRPDLLDGGGICLFGGGRGPRSAHAQAPTAAPPGIESQGS